MRGQEYLAYSVLCKELALPHALREGDWCDDFSGLAVFTPRCVGRDDLVAGGWAWMPSAADWLDMLAEAGVEVVHLRPDTEPARRGDLIRYERTGGHAAWGYRAEGGNPEAHRFRGIGETREEALARLWMAAVPQRAPAR